MLTSGCTSDHDTSTARSLAQCFSMWCKVWFCMVRGIHRLHNLMLYDTFPELKKVNFNFNPGINKLLIYSILGRKIKILCLKIFHELITCCFLLPSRCFWSKMNNSTISYPRPLMSSDINALYQPKYMNITLLKILIIWKLKLKGVRWSLLKIETQRNSPNFWKKNLLYLTANDSTEN